MTPRMIYLVGQPGSGKSTLMEKLTAPYQRLTVEQPVGHDVLIDPTTGSPIGAEIGKRREHFSGTDALASAIIDKAVPCVNTRPYPLILGEGARLGNRRFMLSTLNAGYHLTLVLLDHDDAEEWRLARSKKLKRTQNESWVKGRRSASVNLAAEMRELQAGGVHPVRVWTGHPDGLAEGLSEIIADG